MLFAQVTNLSRRALPVIQTPHGSQPLIGKAHALGLPQDLGRGRLHGMLFQLELHIVNLFELVNKPGVD